jgi:hypothetical protein
LVAGSSPATPKTQAISLPETHSGLAGSIIKSSFYSLKNKIYILLKFLGKKFVDKVKKE